MKRTYFLPLGVIAAVVLIVAGCGGSSKKTSSASTGTSSAASQPTGGAYGGATSAPANTGAGAAIDAKKSSLGTILVDSKGMSIYYFQKDKGPKSTCSGACAAAWPPVTSTGAATAGTGIAKAKLGTSTRSDGTKQVTYNGHPLYTYAGDSSPGQTNGEGLKQFGAEWYVLSPAGNKVEKPGS
jgi:predicted lipoprotein with Yx(FWY)xxD motif